MHSTKDLEAKSEKLRRAAERRAKPERGKADERQSDAEAAEAHSDLTRPEHSKARPRPDGDAEDRGRPSNAGTDGP